MPAASKRIVMLADCQSFYASVEKAAHPEYEGRPVVVAGDPARRSGIILAACPLAKQYGVTTAERLGEALSKCPELVVIQPRMQQYINVSLRITKIFEQFSDLVEPYSIDEQFIDITGTLSSLGGEDAEEVARAIQKKVMDETKIYTRVGIGENKTLAKLACDNFAKKRPTGIFTLKKEELALPGNLWELPVRSLFMIGSRMARHLWLMGIRTIGDLAQTPLPKLRAKWGINGEVIWRIANGIDGSPVSPGTHQVQQKAIGHNMTLPRDYSTWEEIRTVLLELCELVCRRCRDKGLMGQVVSTGCFGADFDHPTGFHRQKKLPDPTYVTDDLFAAASELFQQHWDGQPVRKLGVALGGLTEDRTVQLVLFGDRDRKIALERVKDQIKDKYGDDSILRAVSLTAAGQAKDRAKKIGGHYK
ncbi:DNA polymerase IV [Paenibacillus filicis]|uniref:DNA polymerase IV n=1 Tax=Paenibacillus gyeongsangnamensis TaxID=3388067 RepID=A0ABT4Q6P1_9BACL|nr:DNA polymerase IV [Paenibacillus filicis]MCZ8512489.1 DNA polymerase IV [Paenibacillus filicis]